MRYVVLLIAGFLFSEVSFSQSNSKLVTGIILSEKDNRPLEGAVVWVKGTKNYSGAQPDGVYFIKVLKTDTVLVFAYEGHENTEVRLTGDSEYSVRLRKESDKSTRSRSVSNIKQNH